MNVSENRTDQSESLRVIKAKILNRLIAKAIDFIIVGLLFKTIPGIGYFAGLAYLLIADGLFGGRGIGKRLIRLKVILHETNNPCSFRESIIRNFTFATGYILMMIPLIGLFFAVIILLFESLLVIGSDRGMRLGDELAKTQVIEENPETSDNKS